MSLRLDVYESAFKKIAVKATPNQVLNELLEEICRRFGKTPELHGLRYKDKVVDLSLTIRLAGIQSGGKIDLIKLPVTISLVSVAIQVQDQSSDKSPRLTGKYPSDTSIISLLRDLESKDRTLNLTRRGAARTLNGCDGPGRLYYEAPSIQIMGRLLTTAEDLQKSLAQLGCRQGSILLRLQFQSTQIPFEDSLAVSLAASSPRDNYLPPEERQVDTKMTDGRPSEPQTSEMSSEAFHAQNNASAVGFEQVERKGFNGSPLFTVLAPPRADEPAVASEPHREEDYEPSIDHATMHQARLSAAKANQRLLSDAEVAQKAAEKERVKQERRNLLIKIRFPDQTQVLRNFSTHDSIFVVYDFVRSIIVDSHAEFDLILSTKRGPQNLPKQGPRDTKSLAELDMAGNILLTVSISSSASVDTINGIRLRKEHQNQAVPRESPRFSSIESEIRPRIAEERKVIDGSDRKRAVGGVPKWFRKTGK